MGLSRSPRSLRSAPSSLLPLSSWFETFAHPLRIHLLFPRSLFRAVALGIAPAHATQTKRMCPRVRAVCLRPSARNRRRLKPSVAAGSVGATPTAIRTVHRCGCASAPRPGDPPCSCLTLPLQSEILEQILKPEEVGLVRDRSASLLGSGRSYYSMRLSS